GYTLPTFGAGGTYQWNVTYSGDANNNNASDVNDSREQVTVTATPTITSASYVASTGQLTVNGYNFTASAGDYHPTALTLTRPDGTTYTLTGGNIVGTPSATSFVVNLSTADQLAIDGMLNKNGSSSAGGTTYNLAALSSFDAGGAADTTSTVTVSNAL